MLMVDLSPYAHSVIQERAEQQGITPEVLAKQMLEKALPTKVERPFDFDIAEIDKAIKSGFKPMPKFNSDEEFLAWANA